MILLITLSFCLLQIAVSVVGGLLLDRQLKVIRKAQHEADQRYLEDREWDLERELERLNNRKQRPSIGARSIDGDAVITRRRGE